MDGQQRITTLYLIAKALTYNGSLPQLTFNHTDSFLHIHENNAFIKEWVELNLVKSDRQNFLDYIFDNCQVVKVTVKQISEAFQLFETQNGRGKDLEAYNLLKAYHIRAMTSSSCEEKIDCDVRWEDAAMYTDKTMFQETSYDKLSMNICIDADYGLEARKQVDSQSNVWMNLRGLLLIETPQ